MARRKFFGKIRETYTQHKDAVQITGLVILLIAIFILGYLVSWNCTEKPISADQFEFCEQVVRDVYAQEGKVIVEAPEEVCVTITTTTITVRLSDNTYRGKVVAKLQNGELSMTRDLETGEAIFLSILLGISFVLVAFLVLLLILYIGGKRLN